MIWFSIFLLGFFKLIFNVPSIPLEGMIALIIIISFSLIVFKKIRWNLVDQVDDCENYLVIKNWRREIKVNLNEIRDIYYENGINQAQIHFNVTNSLGDKISYLPKTRFSFMQFAEIEAIKKRISNA